MPPEGSAECAKRRAGMWMRYSQVEAGDGEGLAESTAQVPQSWPPAGRLALCVCVCVCVCEVTLG